MAGCAVDAALKFKSQSNFYRGKGSDIEADNVFSRNNPLIATKVVAEAAMLLRCVDFLGSIDGNIKLQLNKLAQQLIISARDKELLVALCLEPALAFEHAAAHVHLTDLGYRDEVVDCMLTEIIENELIGTPERLPNHQLEHEWLKGIWRQEHSEISADLLERTCIARPLDVLGSRIQDLYAFTHVVLYGSDMGRRPRQWPRSLEEIAQDAEAALAAALDADNLDLAAELIWTWPMLRLPWSPVAIFGFGILAATQDAHGFLPGPGYSAGECERLPDDLRDEYVLRTSYHTTLVMGFVCGAALRAARSPPAEVEPAAEENGAIDMIMPLLRNPAHKPRWWIAFSHLDTKAREALAQFALSVAMRRARASHDLELLSEGLSVALRCDLISGPTTHQALALLRRATMLGQISAGDQ
jgi:hypothetical protein